MKALFKSLKIISGALLFTVPQFLCWGSISSEKVLAQQTSCPTGSTLFSIDWTPTSNLNGFLQQSFNPGGVPVTFNFTESIPGRVIDPSQTLIGSGVYGGIPGPNLRFNIGLPGLDPAPVGSNGTLTINFAQPLTLASPLILMDVDRNGARDIGRIFQDRVTVRAFNNNSPVNVTLRALGPNVRVDGNVARGINENAFPSSSDGNVEVRIIEPITQIQLIYEPGTEYGNPGQDETIGLAKLNVCVPAPNLRLVKRITNASRNGQPISNLNFTSFIDDPNDNNDNILQQAGRSPVGQIDIPGPLRSRDQLEYTIYFLTEGQELQGARFCDLIPAGTSYVPNSLTVNGITNQGRYLSPLTPLDDFANICGDNNTNGAVIVGPTNIRSGQSGFIRFRVSID